MPAISLVVCLYKERDLLERLLQHTEGCYDDLVVVHDGPEEAVPAEDRRAEGGEQPNQKSAINQPPFPSYEEGWKSPEQLSLEEPDAPPFEIARDYAELPKDAAVPSGYRFKAGIPQPGSIHELVLRYGGRFYEGPRCYQQEPHWPFACSQAKHDWILRLDADEYPSVALVEWLKKFRDQAITAPEISGYTCVWPPWDGKKALGSSWPDGRIFLFNRRAVRFFGLVEQVPIPEGKWINLDLVLHHEPKRKSFGFRNILFRRQCWVWRSVIARCLVESSVSQLPRWNYGDSNWPRPFLDMAEHPLLHMYWSVFISWRWALKRIIKARLWSVLYCFYTSGWHHALICLEVLRIRYLCRSKSQRSS
jgi:glycosyltransferase involved in cell wall biosynthesis